jgi:hypothetical protein
MGLFDIFSGKGAQDRFGERAVKRLIELGWSQPLRFDPATFTIDLGPDAGTAELENIFKTWSRVPKRDQGTALDQALAFVFELGPDPTFEEAAPMLLPIVRNRLRMMALPLHAATAAEPDGSPMLTIGEHIAVFPAIDRPHSLAHVTVAVLSDWGRSFDDVMTVARANLAKLPAPDFKPLVEGVLISEFGDYHDASRLLRPELFQALNLKGDPVVVAVAPEALLVTGSQDLTGLNNLGLLARGALEDAVRPISWAPIILRDGDWIMFQSDLTAICDLYVLQKLHDYGQQRLHLMEQVQAEGRKMEVAEFNLFDNGEGLQSFVEWEGSSTLLPRADLVVLRDETDGRIVRDWDDVASACGDFKLEPQMTPPYYMVGGLPDDTAMSAIRAAKGPTWLEGKAVGVANGRLTVFE